jgi:phage gp36-like protein
MARFLTVQELYDRRGESEILRLAAASVAAVESAIGQAEDEAVSYLLSRYGDQLPTTPADSPGILKDKVAVIAHRRLVRGPQVADSLLRETEEALAWLGKVARGVASLNLPEAAARRVDRSGPGILTTRHPDPIPPLSREALEDW